MHERERHRLILRHLAERSVATIADLVALCGASEATIRRDINRLAADDQLLRVRGGVEALDVEHPGDETRKRLSAPSFDQTETLNFHAKRAIAERAVSLCSDDESIIVNGGTTTYRMVEFLLHRDIPVFTNSYPLARDLIEHGTSRVMVPGGEVYREQNIILSPFDDDSTQKFYGARVFMGAQGVGPQGIMEADPLLIQAEQKLMNQGEKLILLVDSSKFSQRSTLILCPLDRIDTIITDDGIDADNAEMVRASGVELITARRETKAGIAAA